MCTCVSERQGLASSRTSSKSRKVVLCARYGGDAACCGWNVGCHAEHSTADGSQLLVRRRIARDFDVLAHICCALLCQNADNGVRFPPLRTCQPGHRWNFNGAENEIRAAPRSWTGPIKGAFVPDGAMAANTVQMMHDDDPIATPFQQRSGAANQPNENNHRTCSNRQNCSLTPFSFLRSTCLSDGGAQTWCDCRRCHVVEVAGSHHSMELAGTVCHVIRSCAQPIRGVAAHIRREENDEDERRRSVFHIIRQPGSRTTSEHDRRMSEATMSQRDARDVACTVMASFDQDGSH